MNAPQPKGEDSHILFESSLIASLLHSKGVPEEDLLCDFAPWDTVGNAWSVRMVVQGLLALRRERRRWWQPWVQRRVDVHVLISDFHHRRMEAAMRWVLDLRPRPLLRSGAVALTVESVPSGDGLARGLRGVGPAEARAAIEERREHEERGSEQLRRNAALVRTEAELSAFLLLGGHKGYREYTTRTLRRGGRARGGAPRAGW
mmetsp:Transcript_11088/g.26308  ORF Transcript_11088/g.26308 Transcript_11088/m.26308 type:complete len:203 (+) Transcript_11088:807-1415(+)